MASIRHTWLWRSGKQFAADPARRIVAKLGNRRRIPVGYFDIPNWGDALNPVLVELLSGCKVQHLDGFFHDRFLVIGSILGAANGRAQVWGSGFIHEGESVMEPPRAIFAVRGPLSRAALLKAGIDCPEVYGDPALLLPRFFNPEVPKQFDVGIIPHAVDKHLPWIQKQRNAPGILVIDVEGGTWEFIRAVKSCKAILSSSLHGLICADAYGVPNAWIRLSDDLIGGGFKFRDYRLSIGAGEPTPISVTADTPLDALAPMAEFHELKIDLCKLLLACPFLTDTLRAEASS
jgi:pyruvyltransferase